MKNITAMGLGTALTLVLTSPGLAQASVDQPTTTGTTAPRQGSTDTTANPDNSAAGDIVVTAQRRTERVTDVPISITVANQAQLQREQINTVNDLNRIAPSLEVEQAAGQNTGGGGSIRGIGTQTFSAGAVASVGIVVDQVSQGNANLSNLFDIARVEVLKGPQGTLFGLTTSAGVINITTNAPDPSRLAAVLHSELSGAGTANSRYGNQIVQGVVNVPLSDDAAIRVSGLLNRRQGPNRNAYDGNLNDLNDFGGRARLLWRPTADLTINLIGDYTDDRETEGGDFFTFVRNDPGTTAELASCGITAGVGNRNFCTRQNFAGHNRNFGGSLQVDYAAGPFTVTSITAARRNLARGFSNATNVFRADPLPIQGENGPIDRRLTLVTQELRLSSPANQTVEYTVGLFASHQQEKRTPETLLVTLSPAPGVVIPIVDSLGADDTITDNSMAIFGQATIHVAPKLRLIAGGRFTAEDISLRRYNLNLGLTDNLQTQKIDVERFSYRAGVQYDLAPRTMVYATAARGYKGGQIATPTLPLNPYPVRPEIPQDYELGLKTTILGGWVVDLNGFYDKIHGFQSQQCIINGAISCVQTNINGVKTRGAEINLFGRVFEGLSVNTGFILAKATYPKGFIGTDGTDIGGTQLAFAPKYKFTFSGEYEHRLTEAFKGFVSANAVWKSRIRYETNSISEVSYLPHWLIGGRVGVRTADNRFAVAVFARNLFDVHEPQILSSSFPFGGAANIAGIYGPDSYRQVGLSFDARF